jgi:hypothetical protein
LLLRHGSSVLSLRPCLGGMGWRLRSTTCSSTATIECLHDSCGLDYCFPQNANPQTQVIWAERLTGDVEVCHMVGGSACCDWLPIVSNRRTNSETSEGPQSRVVCILPTSKPMVRESRCPCRLTMNKGRDYPAAWTADSKAIVFVSNPHQRRCVRSPSELRITSISSSRPSIPCLVASAMSRASRREVQPCGAWTQGQRSTLVHVQRDR